MKLVKHEESEVPEEIEADISVILSKFSLIQEFANYGVYPDDLAAVYLNMIKLATDNIFMLSERVIREKKKIFRMV